MSDHSTSRRSPDAVMRIRLVGRRLVAVQEVPEIDADVRARLAVPDDLRDPHIDLIPARTVQAMVGVEDPNRRGARRQRAGWETAEQLLHNRVGDEQARPVADRAGSVRDARLRPNRRRKSARPLRIVRGRAAKRRLERIDAAAVARIGTVDQHRGRAVVRDGPARARADLQVQLVAQPRVQRHVHAVPVIGAVGTVVRFQRDVVRRAARRPPPSSRRT